MFKEFHYQVRGHGHLRDGTPVQDRTSTSRVAVSRSSALPTALDRHRIPSSAPRPLWMKRAPCSSTGLPSSRRATTVPASRWNSSLSVSKLNDVATRHGVKPGDLASTFLCVAVSGERFLGAHVGDGVVGYVKNGQLRVISAPDNSEFANQTTFVTSGRALESMRLFRGSLDGVAGFILMSDGTGESLFDARTGELAGACEKLIAAVGSAPAQLSRTSEYTKRLRRLVDLRIRDATKDDCSIGILGRTLST